MDIDAIDRELLTMIQRAFPVSPRPYAEIARALDLDEEEVFVRIERLREKGLIRRLGATIDPRALGWYSTLCALDLPSERIDEYAKVVNAYPEVTHNYVREGNPNCWFTIIAPDERRSREIIAAVGQVLGVEVLDLPTRRIFKIGVSFRLT